jgi:hypothetical protein
MFYDRVEEGFCLMEVDFAAGTLAKNSSSSD